MDLDGRCTSIQLFGSRRSSFYSIDGRSENEKRSHDPLMDDSSKDDKSNTYSKRKIMRNVDRNIRENKELHRKNGENYFYDETDFRLGEDAFLDPSKVFSKRKKNKKKNNNDDVCVYKGNKKTADYSWNAATTNTRVKNERSNFKNNCDQVSNDDSCGYYLTNDDENEFCFINDTLTFAQPPHRASV